MTYTHLTTDELVLIESYVNQNISVLNISKQLKRSRQTIHKVVSYFKEGHTALDYYRQYKENKRRCGRRKLILSLDKQEYIKEKVADGWTPDVIVGRGERSIGCSVRTLYRMFKQNVFDQASLPMKGKRKANGHQERRGKQAFKRNISERKTDFPAFSEEFGHLEGDTIVGVHHKSAVITLVERLTKVIITLKPVGRKAKDIEIAIDHWLNSLPRNLFKSITFDCGKEFSNWKNLCNQHDLAIFFADPGTPSQRALNENSNGLLRRNGLPKEMDFNLVDQAFVSSVAAKRNHIPRKSLGYQTPLEMLSSYYPEWAVSSLI